MHKSKRYFLITQRRNTQCSDLKLVLLPQLQQSMMQRQQPLIPRGRYNYYQQEVVATLDLHGCRRDRAIRELTDFLDRVSKFPGEQCWVGVITGSGAHSHGEGPILRTAVHELLKKREITFFLNGGRGGFTVDAKSGLVFYKKVRKEDTKLRVVMRTCQIEGGIINSPKSVVAFTNQSRVYQLKQLLPEYAVSQDAKVEFRRQKEQNMNVRRKERMELKRVISDSNIEFRKDVMIQKQDDDQLSEMLKLSEQEHQESVIEEEELLRKAISLSRNCNEEDADSDLQDALRRSQEEQPDGKYSSDLEEALRRSREEQKQENDLLQHIMAKLSIQNVDRNDEE